MDGQLHVLLPQLVEKSFVIQETLFFSQFVTNGLVIPFLHSPHLIAIPGRENKIKKKKMWKKSCTTAADSFGDLRLPVHTSPCVSCGLVSFDGELYSSIDWFRFTQGFILVVIGSGDSTTSSSPFFSILTLMVKAAVKLVHGVTLRIIPVEISLFVTD